MAHDAEFLADEVQAEIKNSVDEVLAMGEMYDSDKVRAGRAARSLPGPAACCMRAPSSKSKANGRTPRVATPQVGQWTSEILEQLVKRLSQMQKPFKYVTTCLVMQKTGAGDPPPPSSPLPPPTPSRLPPHTPERAPPPAPSAAGLCTGVSCWWDNQTDGSKTFRIELKYMYLIITVFGLSI